VDDGGSVEDVHVGIDEANHGRDAVQVLGHVLEGTLVIEDETPAQQQVLRRVTRQRQLREGNDVGPEVPRPAGVLEDPGSVAFKVTDGRVDLSEGDS
jgi:hypothetical protein